MNRNVPQQPGQPQQHQPILEGEHRIFLCRMNVSRNARRQMRFGDQKVSTHRKNNCLKIKILIGNLKIKKFILYFFITTITCNLFL